MSLVHELTLACRSLWNQPGMTAVAVTALALGIGANTAVFSVVEAMYNFPIPMEEADRVAFMFSENEVRGIQQSPASVDDFLD